MRRWVALVGAVLAPAASAACGASAASPAPAAATINVKDFSFGDKQYVAPGGQVTVKNAGPSVHSIVGLESVAKGSGGDIPAGSTLRFTAPEKIGSYVFTCGFHQQMAGVLVVSTSAKPVPTSSFSIQPGP